MNKKKRATKKTPYEQQSPNLDDDIPDGLNPSEEQEPPPEDPWYCPRCGNSPCLFLQWQEELESIVDIMYAENTNKSKRYHMYRHIAHKYHGPMGKGQRAPLPGCCEQGLKDLFPSKEYTGFKYG